MVLVEGEIGCDSDQAVLDRETKENLMVNGNLYKSRVFQNTLDAFLYKFSDN